MSTDATTAVTRMPPPPLVPRAPDCSICGAETTWEDGYFVCQEGCDAMWPEDTVGHDEPGEWCDEPGEWCDDTQPQCRWVIQPYAFDSNPTLKPLTYRCIRGEDHTNFESANVRRHEGVRTDRTGAPFESDRYDWMPNGTMPRHGRVFQLPAPDEVDEHQADDEPTAPPRVVDVELPPFPHRYCGSDPERQSVGDPGHCEDCCQRGHVAAHPNLGCADVGCTSDHPEDQ